MPKENILSELEFKDIIEYFLLGLTILGFSFALFFAFTNLTNPKSINLVLAIPFIFLMTPYLVLKLYKIKSVESKMSVIPRFLRDVVDNVESGMDLLTSIKTTIGNEYTVLNEDIKKLANQLSWGINFDIAIINFAKNIGSKSLERDFLLVVEARRVGGHVEKILRELSFKINNEILRNKERRSNLASNTFTGYISFGIFLFIIILVFNSLFVQINAAGDQDAIEEGEVELSAESTIYLTLMILLSYELAILSGFLFGLMQDNNIISGAPHVVVLSMLNFVAFFFFVNI